MSRARMPSQVAALHVAGSVSCGGLTSVALTGVATRSGAAGCGTSITAPGRDGVDVSASKTAGKTAGTADAGSDSKLKMSLKNSMRGGTGA